MMLPCALLARSLSCLFAIGSQKSSIPPLTPCSVKMTNYQGDTIAELCISQTISPATYDSLHESHDGGVFVVD